MSVHKCDHKQDTIAQCTEPAVCQVQVFIPFASGPGRQQTFSAWMCREHMDMWCQLQIGALRDPKQFDPENN